MIAAETTFHDRVRSRPTAWAGGTILLIAIVVAGIIARITLLFSLGLFVDESIYVFMGINTPWSFCPHPPGVPLMTLAGISLLGHNEIGIRLGGFFHGLLLLWATYELGRSVGGKWVALWTTACVAMVPFYLFSTAMATPDTPQLLFWTLALAASVRACHSGQTRWWLFTGLATGIGLYFKFMLVLGLPALVLGLLATPNGRAILRTPGPYVAVLLATLLFVPVAAYSEYAANWPTLRYHLAERQSFRLPTLAGLGTWYGLHIILISPLIYGAALAGMYWGAKLWWTRPRTSTHSRLRTGTSHPAGLKPGRDTLLFVAAFALVPFVFFGVISAITKRVLNREQWDAVAFIPALIVFACLLRIQLHRLTLTSRIRWRQIAYTVPLSGLLVSGILITEGLLNPLARTIGFRPVMLNYFGARQLSDVVTRELAQIPVGKDDTPPFLIGNEVGEIFLYQALSGNTETHVFSMDHASIRRFGLVPVLEQAGARQGLIFQREPPGTNALFAAMEDFDWRINKGLADRLERREIKLRQWFRQVEFLEPIPITVAGRPARWIYLYRCMGLVEDQP